MGAQGGVRADGRGTIVRPFSMPPDEPRAYRAWSHRRPRPGMWPAVARSAWAFGISCGVAAASVAALAGCPVLTGAPPGTGDLLLALARGAALTSALEASACGLLLARSVGRLAEAVSDCARGCGRE